ncbi:N-methyl-L-tryptophan oxidase [Pseudomonas prosekii]|uniref:N-methyl-L-tryptophan oxidase n=1 Tax=Pseudomonas prosekii TaxID=1148509 RepID=A0A2U2DCE0_9PSED|nr:N-methyl-L-tryptophan oxidase [Pseudomonas prosekii]PWE47058.1 N-methyl-L-tryptophan oxidase [Pseudomonas prosekii]
MVRKYNVVVVGLGIIGSASLWRLSHSSSNVLGIDAGAPINLSGSSHGASRIFRQAYWEGEAYLPLLSLSGDLWRELENTCDRRLIVETGGLFVGPVASGVVRQSVETARRGNIKHKVLSDTEITRSFPAFQVQAGMEAVYEAGAFTIAADDSKCHMLNVAVRQGAELRFGASVVSIVRSSKGLTLRLSDGVLIHANRVVLATGLGMSTDLISDLSGLIQPKSVPVYWFKPKLNNDRNFARGFPAFLYQLPDGRLLYGTPHIGSEESGIKIGFHNHQQSIFEPEIHRQAVEESCIDEVSACVEQVFPGLNSTPYAHRKCIYTMSCDGSFIVGESVHFPGVFYASACSGHGFKFATGLGDTLAKAALSGVLDESVAIFSAKRFIESSPLYL